MYFYESYYDCWMIKHSLEDEVMFGPFSDEGDVHFVVEMLNKGKLNMNLGESYGKEDSKEQNTVH